MFEVTMHQRPRQHTDGMIVTRSATYDVLRWNGTCSKAVDGDMLTKTAPPKAGAAGVHWTSLNEPPQPASSSATAP